MQGRKALRRLSSAAVLGGAAVYVYARVVEPRWIEVTRTALVLPRLAPEFDGYTVALISDFHMDRWMTPERLSKIVRLVNAQSPDLVAIPGDFATHASGFAAPRTAGALRKLDARDGAVAVLGNHDYSANPETVRWAIRESGVTDINNGVRTLHRGGVALHICGVDDCVEGRDDLDAVLEGLPTPAAAVLLTHEPDFADRSAATGRFDLQLSGHSHGGQVWLPFWGSLFLPRLGRRYPAGLYEVGGMHQYTNRGVGVTLARLRANCRSEVTILTLRAP